MFTRLLIAAASAALMTSVAAAQDSAPTPPVNAPADAAGPPTSEAAPTDRSGYNARAGASADASAAQPALPASSSALGDTTTLKAGDTGVVSNGPVLDTPENRAKYGSPDSHAGKRTPPAGN